MQLTIVDIVGDNILDLVLDFQPTIQDKVDCFHNLLENRSHFVRHRVLLVLMVAVLHQIHQNYRMVRPKSVE